MSRSLKLWARGMAFTCFSAILHKKWIGGYWSWTRSGGGMINNILCARKPSSHELKIDFILNWDQLAFSKSRASTTLTYMFNVPFNWTERFRLSRCEESGDWRRDIPASDVFTSIVFLSLNMYTHLENETVVFKNIFLLNLKFKIFQEVICSLYFVDNYIIC
jgi:hypothetical protein